MSSPTLNKALEAVQLVALRGDLSLREIAHAMKLPKTTAHRLVANLVDARLLRPAGGAQSDRYTLGSLIGELSGELSGASFTWRPLVQLAHDELTAVRDDTGETAGIHMLYGDRRVLLDQVVSHHPHRWVYDNHLVPMPLRAGATGKMFLAMMDADEMARALSRHARGSADRNGDAASLQERLATIRRQGYSISADEINPGITSIAVPVPTRKTGPWPRIVVSLAAPSVRVTDKARRAWVARLQSAARAVGAKLDTAELAR